MPIGPITARTLHAMIRRLRRRGGPFDFAQGRLRPPLHRISWGQTNMSTTLIGISRIGQIQVRAGDVERAASFYETVLGLKLLFKAPRGLRSSMAGECG